MEGAEERNWKGWGYSTVNGSTLYSLQQLPASSLTPSGDSVFMPIKATGYQPTVFETDQNVNGFCGNPPKYRDFLWGWNARLNSDTPCVG
jgi:hypothetical protein